MNIDASTTIATSTASEVRNGLAVTLSAPVSSTVRGRDCTKKNSATVPIAKPIHPARDWLSATAVKIKNAATPHDICVAGPALECAGKPPNTAPDSMKGKTIATYPAK